MGFRMSDTRPDAARRPSTVRTPCKLYYIFAEGEKTESIYFNGLSDYMENVDNIEIKVMDRWKINKGNSNQYAVTKAVEKYIKDTQTLSPEDIKILEQIIINLKEQNITLENFFKLNDILLKLEDGEMIQKNEELFQQVYTILTMSDYEQGFDEICIILDRDKQSFKDIQYEKVLEIAEKNGYRLGISNPNFEFFLLLNITDMTDIPKEDLLRNAKVGKKTRLMENLLKKKCKEYSTNFCKNNYDCDWFLKKFEEGYLNSLNYENDVVKLKENPGTSIFTIIKSLIDSEGEKFKTDID